MSQPNTENEGLGKLYSELLLFIDGATRPEFSALLLEAENASEDKKLRKALFENVMKMAHDPALLDDRVTEGYWAWKQGDGFEPLYRNEEGYCLSFNYAQDLLVLESVFFKDGDK